MDERLLLNLTMGRDLFEKRQFERAERYLAAVIEQSQSFADVYNMLGVISHDRGALEKARAAFEAALKLNPAYVEAALNLAVVLNDLGRYDEAGKIYATALARRKTEPGQLDLSIRGKITNLYAGIGDAWAAVGRLDEAIGEYVRALELSPTFVDIRVKLANALREKGDHAAAVRELSAAVESKPTYLPARVALGLALFGAGRKEEAIAAWQEVIERSPTDKQAAMYLKLVRGGAA